MTSEPSEPIIAEWNAPPGQMPPSADPVPAPQFAARTDRELRTTFEQALEYLPSGMQTGDAVSAARSLSRQLILFAEGDPGEEAWVAQLIADLRLARFHPLPLPQSSPFDSQSFLPLQEGMADGDQILVVCTPNCWRRDFDATADDSEEPALLQQQALSKERNERKTIFPLLLRGSRVSAVPTFLRQHEEIDFRQASRYYEQALALFLTLQGSTRDAPNFRGWMKLLAGTTANPSISTEAGEPEEVIDPHRMRLALRRIGASAAEAAAQVGQLVSVWRNGEVALESPANSGPPTGDA